MLRMASKCQNMFVNDTKQEAKEMTGLAVLTVGCAVGWTTPTIKRLKSPTSEIPIDGPQSSWLAAAHEIGHIISPIPAGYAVEKFGAKPCLLVGNALALVGWILIICTRSVNVLYVVRGLFGLAMGVVFTTVPLYIGEVSSPEVRGAFSTCFQAMLNLGHLIEFSAGPYVSYSSLGWLSFAVTFVFFVVAPLYMVESPQTLLRRGKRDSAAKALECLRGPQFDLRELEPSPRRRLSGLLAPGYRKKLAVLISVAVAQRFTGMSAVVAYAATTFASTKGGLSSDQYTIVFGAIGFFFTFVSTVLLDRLGRRPLMLASCSGCAIFHIITGVYFSLSFESRESLTWLPFLTISIFSVLYSLGIGPLLNTLQGELFPPDLKGPASSLTTIAHGVASFIVTKLFQVIREAWGIKWNFYVFAVFCLVSLVFAYFAVPETKRKPLSELQRAEG